MLLFLLLLALPSVAQDIAPQWVDEAWRSSHYPNSEWYIGFATDRIANGQPDSKAYETVEKNAQVKLSESIAVIITGSSVVQTTSKQTQKGETINTNYNQSVKTASNAVLAKVEVKSYFDKKTSNIYGFAAVKKKDLADFYRSGINSIFSFAEKEFIRAEVLAEQGKKNPAFGKIQEIEDSLKNVAYWGNLLQMVESDNSYIKREQDFWKRLNEAKKSLEHGTSVYFNISGDNSLETLSAEMQEKGCNCSIAEKASDADYVVKIKVKLGSCIENTSSKFGEIYCYASANVSMNNNNYKKPLDVKIPDAKGGWGNLNKEKATDQAIKELTNNIAEKIIQSINK